MRNRILQINEIYMDILMIINSDSRTIQTWLFFGRIRKDALISLADPLAQNNIDKLA